VRPLTPSEQKLLFALVRDALHRGSGNQIEAKRRGNKHIPTLRSLGYLEGSELTEKAFQLLFQPYALAPSPSGVQQLADSFGIEICWRRPHGIIKAKLDRAGEGLSYRNLRTAFVSAGAQLETWYHEFGHILYGCVKNNPEILALFKTLQQEAVAAYPIVSQERMTPVQRAFTSELVSPSPGRYVLINGRYHGLDHSGGEAEGEADELWASLFEEYQSRRELKREVRALTEQIIAAIGALPKPLDPCDKE
jgi:hypothetical protein